MTGVAYGAGKAYPSGAPDFTTGFHGGSCCPFINVSLFHVIVLSLWILSFDCSFCLIAWYLYFLLGKTWELFAIDLVTLFRDRCTYP